MIGKAPLYLVLAALGDGLFVVDSATGVARAAHDRVTDLASEGSMGIVVSVMSRPIPPGEEHGVVSYGVEEATNG